VIDAPKLTRVGSMWVSAGIMKADALLTAGGISLESAHLTAARLTAVENWFYIQAASDVDVPALASVGGDFWYMIDVSKTFPALSSIGQRFRIETTAATLSFPALTSIGGDVSITDSAPGSSISLPVLQALNGIATPASIDVIGSFSAPAVIGANKGLVIRSVSSLDLSALQSVGDAMAPCGHDGINRAHWMNVLDLAALRVSVLQLPALTSACVQVGLAIQQCISGNPSLVQIVAPNLTAGGVRFFDNPSFPKCRAEALAAQIPNPVQYPPPFVDAGLGAIHCPLASGPCP
jgi:hypothetical protein